MSESRRGGGKVDPPGPPVDPSLYDVHVKMPSEAEDDPGRAQEYLTRIADELNASDTTYITADPAHPVFTDPQGDTWAKGSMVVPMNLGCGTKHGDDEGWGDEGWGDDGDGDQG